MTHRLPQYLILNFISWTTGTQSTAVISMNCTEEVEQTKGRNGIVKVVLAFFISTKSKLSTSNELSFTMHAPTEFLQVLYSFLAIVACVSATRKSSHNCSWHPVGQAGACPLIRRSTGRQWFGGRRDIRWWWDSIWKLQRSDNRQDTMIVNVICLILVK